MSKHPAPTPHPPPTVPRPARFSEDEVTLPPPPATPSGHSELRDAMSEMEARLAARITEALRLAARASQGNLDAAARDALRDSRLAEVEERVAQVSATVSSAAGKATKEAIDARFDGLASPKVVAGIVVTLQLLGELVRAGFHGFGK